MIQVREKKRPHIVTVNPYSSMKDSSKRKKEIESTHLAEFRECNISITNVCTELNWEVEKTPLIDVTLYEKNIDS